MTISSIKRQIGLSSVSSTETVPEQGTRRETSETPTFDAHQNRMRDRLLNDFSKNSETPATVDKSPTCGSLDNKGGGGNDPRMEARIARLETLAESTDKRLSTIEGDVRDLRKDVRQILYAIIAGCAVIIGVFAYGYFRVEDKTDARFSKVEEKLEVKIDRILERLPSQDAK